MKTIIAEVYPSRRRLLKPTWRIRFVGRNGERIGHEYNSVALAIEAIDLMVDPDVAVILRAPGISDERIR